MLKLNIRLRLIASFLLLIVVTMSLLGSYILWYFYQHNLTSLTTNLFTHAHITEQLIYKQMANTAEKATIDATIKELAANTDIRITVIDTTGTIVADSWENVVLMENHLDRPEVSAALAGNKGSNIRFSTTLQQNTLYAAVPIRHQAEISGAVRVASTLSHIEAGFNEIKIAILTAIFFTSLLAIALSISLARRYTAPLETITSTAKQIGNGHLDERVHIRTGDEIEILAHTLNNLASNLDDKINEISSEKSKLELILQYMDNAVILLDKYGRVITANKKALETFDMTPAMLGQHNIQVIASSLFDQTVHEIINTGDSRSINLTTNIHNSKRIFQVFLAPINIEKEINGILSVFHDITTLQEIQERQSDFIANASHELATPLTSIKGFAETLLDGELQNPELSVKFVTIIHNEAERMQRLVADLLKLAQLNSHEYNRQVIMQAIYLQPLLQTVVHELSPHFTQKQLTINIQPIENEIPVMGNADYLKQVLLNLLENSIKYTPNNGAIWVTCLQENRQAIIMIKDSGIGIPQQDLPLIFERFYRVDRARSRAQGGTGLGLSIVKFIIELHGGTINVQSQVNIGTTFTFTLPLAIDDKQLE